MVRTRSAAVKNPSVENLQSLSPQKKRRGKSKKTVIKEDISSNGDVVSSNGEVDGLSISKKKKAIDASSDQGTASKVTADLEAFQHRPKISRTPPPVSNPSTPQQVGNGETLDEVKAFESKSKISRTPPRISQVSDTSGSFSQSIVSSFSEDNSRWQPNGWKLILENIRKMRSGEDAPVDTMGCERCVDDKATPKQKRYQILVSLLLSSQTKDEVTSAASARLRELGLTPQNMAEMDEEKIRETIYPVGFYKNKAKYLKQMSKILVDKYDSDIPKTVEELCALPGIGPKMAYLAMNCAWMQAAGIGVDTHVHRIANRLKWVRKPTKTPEDTRKQLEAWLPREYWTEINWLLVGLGQTICTPKNPKCSQCLNNKICPSADKRLSF